MNATQDYIEKKIAVCQNEWFKEHTASFILETIPPTEATILNWQKPGTWNYGMRFIIHRRWLVVLGDLGEAVYGWGQDITPDFLAQLNFDYFHSKCEASENGRKFESFDGQTGYRLAQEWLADPENQPGHPGKNLRKHIRALTASCGKEEVDFAAREIYDATGDAELASMIIDWFKVPSFRCIAHFVGLQMALKQLSLNANPSSQTEPA